MTIEERRAKFMREAIGTRTRAQLAAELFGIYLMARANCHESTDESDPWPANLHLADVLDKYAIPSVIKEKVRCVN
jgi:hypothetical protein